MTSTSNNASQEACKIKIKCSKCHQEITIDVSNRGDIDTLHPVFEVYDGDGVKTLEQGVVNTFCYKNKCPNPDCGQEISFNIIDDPLHHPEPEKSGADFVGKTPTVKELIEMLDKSTDC